MENDNSFPAPAADQLPAGYRYLEKNERAREGDLCWSYDDGSFFNLSYDVWVHVPNRYATKRKKRRARQTAETPHCYSGIARSSSKVAAYENNDCAVVALAWAAGCSYDDAWAFWDLHGRKAGKGTYTHRTFPAQGSKDFPELGIRVTAMGRRESDGTLQPVNPAIYVGENCDRNVWAHKINATLRTLVREEPMRKGSYLVCVAGHALAVVDGTVVDHSTADLRRVKRVYRVEKI